MAGRPRHHQPTGPSPMEKIIKAAVERGASDDTGWRRSDVADGSNEPVAPPVDGLDDALAHAVVADRTARRRHAVGQHGLADRFARPHCAQEIVLREHAVAMASVVQAQEKPARLNVRA